MSRIRRWYAYNNVPGGQLSQLNYFYFGNLPNACMLLANNICAVKGIYADVVNGVLTTYGTNPKTFASDTKIASYIIAALGAGIASPAPPQKPYVYVRNFS